MWLSVIALISIVPAVAQAFREEARRDRVFWGTLLTAVAGPLAWILVHNAAAWQTGLAATLWVTIATSLAMFALIALIFPQAWRLGPLLAGYMLLLGLGAVVWHDRPGEPLQATAGERGWVSIHIALGVVTYGLVTVAAVSAFAAFQQERALKRKQPTALTRHLPSIALCESLQLSLLQTGWLVLGVGLLTGMALQWEESGQWLPFNHKVVLTLAAFAVIGALLAAQRWAGVRGRLAARIVLLGYLLLTLGYAGVKFVSEVLMG
ncbi:MAG: cytochrome c biogenesis protein CcsA [Rhodospirillales bacterium]